VKPELSKGAMTMKRKLIILAGAITSITAIFILAKFLLIFGVFNSFFNTDSIQTPDTKNAAQAWQAEEPEVTIENAQYYRQGCSILEVNTQHQAHTSRTIFSVPSDFISTCKSFSLSYEDEYLIFEVCQQAFSAGSCSRELYRSKDMTQWQEEIGVTYRNDEAYIAWRNLGSTSSKADGISKIKEPY
jgi:hypothetical protein